MGPIEQKFYEYCLKYPNLSKSAIITKMRTECNDLNITPKMAEALIDGKSIFMLEIQSKSLANFTVGQNNIFSNYFSNHTLPFNPDRNLENGANLALLLYDDISGIGSGDLKKHIKMINKDNVQGVLQAYFIFSCMQSEMHNYNFINGLRYPIEGLIMAIDNEYGLSEKTKKELINHITQAVLQSGYDNEQYRRDNEILNISLYADDIKKDILQHQSDYEKLDIDMLRFGYRGVGIVNNDNYVPANGKIDNDFEQGFTGNCGLISDLISICNNPISKEYLESLLEHDKTNGDITVNLKGIGKKYKISAQDIEKSNHLSIGDGDIRAIEIALDRAIRDNAYSKYEWSFYEYDDEYDLVDISTNAIDPLTVFSYLGFYAEIFPTLLISGLNFNTKDVSGFQRDCWTIVIHQANIQATSVETNEVLELKQNHGYSIVGSDKDFIYLKDPDSISNETITDISTKKGLLRVVRTDLANSDNVTLYGASVSEPEPQNMLYQKFQKI